MPDRRRQERVLELLRAYAVDSNRLAHRYAALAEVHPTDMQALEVLSRGTDRLLTIGELGDALDLSSGSVTGLVDRLEHAGHVERVRDPADRRRIHLCVTEGAMDVAVSFFGPWAQRLHAAMEDFSDAELETIARFLEAAVATTQDPAAR